MVFSFLSFPCKHLLLQQLFIGGAHVEQWSVFEEKLLENKNRTISDTS